MKLKVFRLKEGRLEFTGTREPMIGDGILEGGTSMAEVRPGVIELREASTSDFPMYFKTELAPPTQAELARAKAKIGHDALAKSYKAAHPQASDKEVNAFVQGRSPAGPESSSLDDSIRKAHPEYTDKQIDIFKRGRA
jgi:hypothetical protein